MWLYHPHCSLWLFLKSYQEMSSDIIMWWTPVHVNICTSQLFSITTTTLAIQSTQSTHIIINYTKFFIKKFSSISWPTLCHKVSMYESHYFTVITTILQTRVGYMGAKLLKYFNAFPYNSDLLPLTTFCIQHHHKHDVSITDNCPQPSTAIKR